jgi:co-chaperonin GroES (HSP10)
MLIPAGYRILLKMEEVVEKTAGGIILAQQTIDADEAASKRGTVVAIGEFAYKEYPAHWCKVGDVVTIAKYAGTIEEDPADGQRYRAINDIDVICVATL